MNGIKANEVVNLLYGSMSAESTYKLNDDLFIRLQQGDIDQQLIAQVNTVVAEIKKLTNLVQPIVKP